MTGHGGRRCCVVAWMKRRLGSGCVRGRWGGRRRRGRRRGSSCRWDIVFECAVPNFPTVVAPNANSPDPVSAMDRADNDTTQIYISDDDPALDFALFGSQTVDDWQAQFGDRVHISHQASHNLDRYADANQMCATYHNPSACGIHQPLNPMGPP